jgi:hypothetical protein
MALQYNILPSSGNANGLAAGSVIAGNAIMLGDGSRIKRTFLSALITVLAETNTLTFSFKWQVSNDGSTWVDVANGTQNAGAVAIATGTSGADTAVSKVFPFPDNCLGWKFARWALVTGGATGTSSDTYAGGYCCRSAKFRSAD